MNDCACKSPVSTVTGFLNSCQNWTDELIRLGSMMRSNGTLVVQ